MPDIILRWFDHWLKGIDNGIATEPAVRYFAMGAEGGWRTADTWPPETTPTQLHLASAGDARHAAGGGNLGDRAEQTAAAPEDTFDYDPTNPTPTLWSKAWFTGPGDRHQLEHRSDILCYRSAPLIEAVEIAGYPKVVLHVSSTAPDTDFFARLVDEPQHGPAAEVCYGMMRMRHRNGLDQDETVPPGNTVELQIELGPTACRFAPGHRIRLEITSSDFPNHDRNHNTGRNDLTDSELVTATNTVHHGAQHPSRLVLPVAETI
jgi:putative CocE/NonD family hydrolase